MTLHVFQTYFCVYICFPCPKTLQIDTKFMVLVPILRNIQHFYDFGGHFEFVGNIFQFLVTNHLGSVCNRFKSPNTTVDSCSYYLNTYIVTNTFFSDNHDLGVGQILLQTLANCRKTNEDKWILFFVACRPIYWATFCQIKSNLNRWNFFSSV